MSQGVTAETADTSENNFTFNNVLEMFIVDIILFTVLAWYFGAVSTFPCATSLLIPLRADPEQPCLQYSCRLDRATGGRPAEEDLSYSVVRATALVDTAF